MVNAAFKAPQNPQLRVGRRPCRSRECTQKFWRKFEWILYCL